ncbi:hypothetical protein Pmar_PMAR020702 [Perkinsus marinus ATCC 50983]|uniref:Uncharacterized protein n=1 Tax=Perkinsus marinus (strain ATCC 50983 / TXsc) TaxID=423536 RepID=C5L7S3_PERM5|nr:hypothetical protein Pmar_PMAR020702 [Perkinsus marinus ATCC 50983]EER07535.1 hypothetical protein Pmar_PMAR020702 [Perkinsus marinus ATCC 50983]|eukprot:XP_002775719.1 hypothetical protein Pmar_PMAR020702 [Perkinsus marinus ATCC 50983]
MIPQICLISAVIAALPLEVESNEKSLSGGMSSRQFLGSSNYACDHHTDVCSIAVQGVGMRASDSLMAYGHDSIPKAASSNTIRVPDSNRLIGGTQQLDMPGEEWVFTIDINSLDPGRYDLYVFTASDEIYLGVLVVVDLGMDSGTGDTTTPIPTTMAFTTGVLIPIIPTTGTIEDSDGSNSIAIYVGLIGGLSGGLLGIVCILIAACAYCGWSARRKGFKELKDIESYYSRDDGRCDNDDSASIISRHINALHHITSSNGVDIHQDSNDDDIHSELSLLSLDPLCHLAATTTGGMPHDEEGVRRGAIPGEPIAPAPSIRRNGNHSLSVDKQQQLRRRLI